MGFWKTNRKTKKPFKNPLGSDLIRGNTRQEEIVNAIDESESVVCERCGSGKSVVVDEGVVICKGCLAQFESREAENLKLGSTVIGDIPLVDDKHTIHPTAGIA